MPTTNPVPSTDPTDLLFNAGKLDEVVNGTANSFTDRLGVTRRTIGGIDAEAETRMDAIDAAAIAQRDNIQDAADLVLAAAGYAPPVAYAAGIGLTLQTQTVSYNGDTYAPKQSELPFTTSGTFETAKFRLIQGVSSADLPALVGQDLQDYAALRAYTGLAKRIYITGLLVKAKPVGIAGVFQYDPTDTTSADNGGTIIVGADGRRWKRDFIGPVNIQWFGAVGDWSGTTGTDNTAAIHTAINVAKNRRASVFVPSGGYRVTSKYLQSVSRADVHIFGEGTTREGYGGSCIVLDSTDPASMFYESTINHSLQVNDIVFTCAQFAKDRAFFKLGNNTSQFFSRVNFESVERPIVWPAGTYFQNATYRDVQFRNSGTFHSETTSLIGGMIYFDNVNHEGIVPDNTEKVACNLSGLRQIQGTDFLLEGVSPGAGWTILKLGTTYDVEWTGAPTASFNGFWIEFSGTPYSYCIDQFRGTVEIKNSNTFITANNKYRLTEKAILLLDVSGFTGSSFDPATAFEMDSTNCTVVLKNGAVRFTRQLVQQRIFYDDCYVASSDNNASMARFSSNAPELLYAYDGKPFDAALVSSGAFGGSTIRHETDATYGRKLSIYPASNAVDAYIRATSFAAFNIGDQFFIKVRAKLPVFAGGQIQFRAVNGTTPIVPFGFDAATYSGQIVTLTIPFRLTASASSVGFNVVAAAVTAMTDPVEIYHLEIYRGGTFPNSYRTAYPSKLTFHATAAPANGTWAAGDRAINSAPAVGQPKSWVCTVAGTPGTWVSEGNL